MAANMDLWRGKTSAAVLRMRDMPAFCGPAGLGKVQTLR
jgi:hypothetical protein